MKLIISLLLIFGLSLISNPLTQNQAWASGSEATGGGVSAEEDEADEEAEEEADEENDGKSDGESNRSRRKKNRKKSQKKTEEKPADES